MTDTSVGRTHALGGGALWGRGQGAIAWELDTIYGMSGTDASVVQGWSY